MPLPASLPPLLQPGHWHGLERQEWELGPAPSLRVLCGNPEPWGLPLSPPHPPLDIRGKD